MKQFLRFIGSVLLVFIAATITLKFKASLGWSPDVILPTIAVCGFLLEPFMLALLILIFTWVLNWQIGSVPAELWTLGGVAFAAWLGKRFLPSSPWVTLATVIGVGEIVFYAVIGPSIFWSHLSFIVPNLIFALCYGLALARLVEWIYA